MIRLKQCALALALTASLAPGLSCADDGEPEQGPTQDEMEQVATNLCEKELECGFTAQLTFWWAQDQRETRRVRCEGGSSGATGRCQGVTDGRVGNWARLGVTTRTSQAQSPCAPQLYYEMSSA